MVRALVFWVAWCSAVSAIRWPAASDDCSPCTCSYIRRTLPPVARQGKVADCSGQRLTSVPHSMPKDITFLDLSHNNIQALLDKEINGYYYLNGIDFSYNNMTTISRGAFTTAPYLKFIELTGNYLQFDSPHGFEDLPSLLEIKGLYMDNPSNELFAGIRQLHFLELRIGSSELHEDIFSDMKLRHLKLCLDTTERIPKTILHSLSLSLISLELKANHITSVDKELLLNLLLLQTVKLEMDALKSLPHEFFHREVIPQGDHSMLPKSYYTLKEVSIIGVDHISPVFLQHFPNLESLTIQKTGFIHGDLFYKLLRLNSLNLSDNGISKIENHWFNDLKSLKILNLSHNNLTVLRTSEFSKMFSIKELDLSNNNIHIVESNCLASFQNSLELLDLSSNQICTLPAGIFSSMYQLQDLNLGNNCLAEITSELWDGSHNAESVQNLRHFNVSNNNISILPTDLFQSALMLTTLDLSNNQLQSLPTEMILYNEQLILVKLEGNPLNCDCGIVQLLFLDLKDSLKGFCKTPTFLANKALHHITEPEACPEMFIDTTTNIVVSFMPSTPPTLASPVMIPSLTTISYMDNGLEGEDDNITLPNHFFTILFDAKLDGEKVHGTITGKMNNTRFAGYLVGTKTGSEIWGTFHGDMNSSTEFVGNYYCGSVAGGKLSGTFVGFFNKTGVNGIIGGVVENSSISGQFVEFGVSDAGMGDVLGNLDDDDLGGTLNACIDGPFIRGHYTGSVDDIALAGTLIGTRDGHILDGMIMSSTTETRLPMDASFVGTMMDLNVSGIFVGAIDGYPVNGCILGTVNDTKLSFPMKAILGQDRLEQVTDPALSTGSNTGTVKGFVNATHMMGSFMGSIEGKPVHGTLVAINNEGQLRGKLISADGVAIPLDAVWSGEMIDSKIIASFVGVLDGDSVKGHIKVDVNGNNFDGGFGGIYSVTDFSKYVTHAQHGKGILRGIFNVTDSQTALLPVLQNVLLEWNSKVNEEGKGFWVANMDSEGIKVNFTGTLDNGILDTIFSGMVNGTEVSGNLSATVNGSNMNGMFSAIVKDNIISGSISTQGDTFVVSFMEEGAGTERDEPVLPNKTSIPLEVQLVLEDVLLQWIRKMSNDSNGLWKSSLNNTALTGDFSGAVQDGEFETSFKGVVNGKEVEVMLTVPVKGPVLNGTFSASLGNETMRGAVSKGVDGLIVRLDERKIIECRDQDCATKPTLRATTEENSTPHYVSVPRELRVVTDNVLLPWIRKVYNGTEGDYETFLNDSDLTGKFNGDVKDGSIFASFKGTANGTEISVVLIIATHNPFLNISVTNGSIISTVGGVSLSGVISSDGNFFVVWLDNRDWLDDTESISGGQATKPISPSIVAVTGTSVKDESDNENLSVTSNPDSGFGDGGVRTGIRPKAGSQAKHTEANTRKWWVPLIAVVLFALVVASILGIIKARGWLYKRNYTVNKE